MARRAIGGRLRGLISKRLRCYNAGGAVSERTSAWLKRACLTSIGRRRGILKARTALVHADVAARQRASGHEAASLFEFSAGEASPCCHADADANVATGSVLGAGSRASPRGGGGAPLPAHA
jgi:hypothetical protein